MNNDKLKSIIEEAREKKKISQRQLAKLTGYSHSTLNDIINGKIKKVDIDALRKIADALDISLVNMLKASGYEDFALFLKASDKYANKSNKDLKDLLEAYEKSELSLLDFDAKKRNIVKKSREELFEIIEKLKNDKIDKNEEIDRLQQVFDNLKDVEEKYDYSKLVKK